MSRAIRSRGHGHAPYRPTLSSSIVTITTCRDGLADPALRTIRSYTKRSTTIDGPRTTMNAATATSEARNAAKSVGEPSPLRLRRSVNRDPLDGALARPNTRTLYERP